MGHIPVLLNEILEYLRPKPGDRIIDGTFSGGGHSLAILEKIRLQGEVPTSSRILDGEAIGSSSEAGIASGGRILGIELDKELYKKAREKFSNVREIILINGNYRNLKKIAEENDFGGADGILLDLGMSSWHLEESGRGFSFQKDELLDMRFTESGPTAAEIVNQWPPEEIEKILREYGEERFAGPISKWIVKSRKNRPIISTFQLVEAIGRAVPPWYQKGRRINFATKTFQALRIAANGELDNLSAAISQMPEVLKKGGPPEARLANGGRGLIISFHSLEDKVVKEGFKALEGATKAQIITKKPVKPSIKEIGENRRSRSAKLRVIEAE